MTVPSRDPVRGALAGYERLTPDYLDAQERRALAILRGLDDVQRSFAMRDLETRRLAAGGRGDG